MPLYYPSWIRDTLTLEKVLEVNGSPSAEGSPAFFRIEILLSEASNLYVARCFRRQSGHLEDIWRLEGESSGHGNADDAIQLANDTAGRNPPRSAKPAPRPNNS